MKNFLKALLVSSIIWLAVYALLVLYAGPAYLSDTVTLTDAERIRGSKIFDLTGYWSLIWLFLSLFLFKGKYGRLAGLLTGLIFIILDFFFFTPNLKSMSDGSFDGIQNFILGGLYIVVIAVTILITIVIEGIKSYREKKRYN